MHARVWLQECKVTRKYGVESTTTITLFDPAAFFATGAPEAKASSGPTDGSGQYMANGADAAQLTAMWLYHCHVVATYFDQE